MSKKWEAVHAPDGEPLDMVGMFMGEYQGFNVFNAKLQLIHALEHLAPRKAVVDHDESLRSLYECAVTL